MGQTTASAESPLYYDLPVARYEGAKAPDLARRYSGATRLTRFAINSAFTFQPQMRVQAEGWARRGRLDMAVGFVGAELGHLLIGLQVMDRGKIVVLGTVHNSDAVTLENWDAHWQRMDQGGFMVNDVSHRTLRGSESFNYTGEVPVVHEPVEGATLASLGSVGLRADNAFRRYHDILAGGTGTGEIHLQSLHFKPPDEPIGSPV